MIIFGIYGSFDWNSNKSFDENDNHTWCHDSGASLFVDGKHICSISEERLTRNKFEGNFPINSINYCLGMAKISPLDVDIVSIPSMCVDNFYIKWYEGIVNKIILDIFPNAEIKFISHHLSHAAASVFSCDFKKGTFLTLDGTGSLILNQNYSLESVEVSSIGYFDKTKNIFKFFPGINRTNNFGEFYHNCSHRIYCEKINKEFDVYTEKYRETYFGKIMGLSAYGRNTTILDKHKLYKNGKDLCYEDFPYISFDLYSMQYFEDKNADEKAFILQKNFEHGMLEYLTDLKNNSYIDDYVCFSGGVFLNVLANSKIKKSGLFKKIHIPPFTNDIGLHFGAACYQLFKSKECINLPKNISLLGKEYSQQEIETSLKTHKIDYVKYENFNTLCSEVAQILNENKIVAWFQGRSEFGPRALGSRSILMHPGPHQNKNILNSRVKHREYWRPFAGIILEDKLNEYFYEDFCSPYMLYSLTAKEEKISEIRSIIHEDNTCRIQTTNRSLNKKITLLIENFEKVSKIPVILNTSFNDNGEPIVESPDDAIKCFNNMDIDYLVIGNFLVKK